MAHILSGTSLRWALILSLFLLPAGAWPSAAPQEAPQAAPSSAPVLSDAEIERFLKEAEIVKTKGAPKGITGSIRATLNDGKITHDAHIQVIEEFKREFQSAKGVEFNFRDSWTFNVAGYKLDRLLGLNMVPVSIERRYRTQPAAYTWWVDDVLMDEGQRLKEKVSPPKPLQWNSQMQLVRVFDQLIYNVDRNMGNLLIAKDWRVWAIDHTRAFRTMTSLKTPENITRCDRQVFEKLKQLDRDTLKREMAGYLDDGQIRALLARRDLIVAQLEKGGPSALFDR